MKNATPHHDASFLSTGLGWSLAAALLAAGCLTGCDTDGDDSADRALELDDEDLDDEDLDALVAAHDAEEAEAPALVDTAAVETIADVIASLPPEAIEHDRLPADLDRPVEVIATELVIDSDGNGVIDGMDELVTATDPMAIGELACATASLANPTHGAAVPMSTAPNCGYAWDGSTSPNTSYDAPGCPHQYITEVTGTFGKPLSFYWGWAGANLTQSNCEMAHANLSAYGAFFNFLSGAVSWTKIGTSSVHGKWVSGPWFSYCDWEYDAGSGPLPSLGNHIYFKVRTAVQGTAFIFKQRVEGGVTHGSGPC